MWVDELSSLLQWYARSESDSANNSHLMLQLASARCKELLSRDYEFVSVDNTRHELCDSYPPELLLVTRDKHSGVGNAMSHMFENELHERFEACRIARARTRFVCPVLMINGRLVCRSSTLSVKGEMAGRWALGAVKEWMWGTNNKRPDKAASSPAATTTTTNNHSSSSSTPKLERQDSLVSANRNAEVDLLHALGVRIIVDLMLEHKKQKFGIAITSSEKADTFGRYADFLLYALPFPGLEAFGNFSSNPAHFTEVVPDWTLEENDAELFLPENPGFDDIDWKTLKQWPLRELTINYLRVIVSLLSHPHKQQHHHPHDTKTDAKSNVKHEAAAPEIHIAPAAPGTGVIIDDPINNLNNLNNNNNNNNNVVPAAHLLQAELHQPQGVMSQPVIGTSKPPAPAHAPSLLAGPPPVPPRNYQSSVLIHCISGWDRTPTYISLLRCLAWAEGLAHTSLSAEEMLYFTVAYDWVLFRHRLANRLQRRAEIMFFAFFFLQFLVDPRLSFSTSGGAHTGMRGTVSSNERQAKLMALYELFAACWKKVKW